MIPSSKAGEGEEVTERTWYPMHDHEDSVALVRHTHHKDNTGHGSHEGVPLVTREEAMAVADGTERPEDTVRRFALRIQELEAWQTKYRTAAELWDSLELKEHDQVTEALTIAKISDFGEGGTGVSMGATDGCDWVVQLGLLKAAMNITDMQTPMEGNND